MNKTYVVKVKDTNDDRTILGILDYGTIDCVLESLNIFIVTVGDHAENELRKLYCVIKVEEDSKIF